MTALPRVRGRLEIADLPQVLRAQPSELEMLEQDFGGARAVAVPSARVGLELVLTALDAPGSEIVMPALGFAPLMKSVRRAGWRARIADVRDRDVHVDVDAIDAACTTRTAAILVTHAYGRPMPMARVLELARRRGLMVIEDAAQAFGASGMGEGDVLLHSFGPTKPLGGWGGGMVVCRDRSIADRVRRALRPARGATLRLWRGAILEASTQAPIHPIAVRASSIPWIYKAITRPSSGPWHRAPMCPRTAALVRLRMIDDAEHRARRRALHARLADQIEGAWPDPIGGIGWGLLVEVDDAPRAAYLARCLGVDAVAGELQSLGAPHADRIAQTLLRFPVLSGASPREIDHLMQVIRRLSERRDR
jgi:hypothetical protein